MRRDAPVRQWLVSSLAVILWIAMATLAPSQTLSVAERLGLPRDTKLLIIHADDLAVAHSVDEASFEAIETGAVSSASVMVPCPWLTEVADFARAHPAADIGLHLTLTSEWKTYRWGPVASRAQVEAALKLGIHPTHLDTHMGTLAATAPFYAAFAKVAHQYRLPFLAVRVNDERRDWLKVLNPNDIVLDRLIIADPSVPPAQWSEFYANAIRSLQLGLTEMIVHLGHDGAELQAITVDHPDYGAAWRARDFKEVTSPAFKELLQQNDVHVIGWRDLDKLVR